MKQIVIWLLALLPLTIEASPARLSIEPISIGVVWQEEIELVINLTNPQDKISIIEFTLRLPEGKRLKREGRRRKLVYELSERLDEGDFTLFDQELADGTTYFVLADYDKLTAISGTEGAIITLTLEGDDYWYDGLDIWLEDISMATASQQKITQENYKYTIGTWPSESAFLSVADGFSISAGGESELAINLTNPDDEITQLHFNLRLPKGLSLKKNGNKYVCSTTNRVSYLHTLRCDYAEDVYRVWLTVSNASLIYEPDEAVISGTEGAVIKMSIVADGTFREGSAIRLENNSLTRSGGAEILPPDVEYFVGKRKGDVNGDNNVDIVDVATIISMIADKTSIANALQNTADVNDDGKVDVADITTIISIIAEEQ